MGATRSIGWGTMGAKHRRGRRGKASYEKRHGSRQARRRTRHSLSPVVAAACGVPFLGTPVSPQFVPHAALRFGNLPRRRIPCIHAADLPRRSLGHPPLFDAASALDRARDTQGAHGGSGIRHPVRPRPDNPVGPALSRSPQHASLRDAGHRRGGLHSPRYHALGALVPDGLP